MSSAPTLFLANALSRRVSVSVHGRVTSIWLSARSRRGDGWLRRGLAGLPDQPTKCLTLGTEVLVLLKTSCEVAIACFALAPSNHG
jgi:hypothetical protein